MQYSPKLKTAMDEIKAVLKKNDIAGFVVLHTPGFSEYLNHLDTSYSCAKLDNDGLFFKIVTADVGVEKAKSLATNTLNLCRHFSEIIPRYCLMYVDSYKMLNKKLCGQDLPGGGHSDHRAQNN